MSKTRLDLLLVERGLAESRAKAQALVMAGQVRVDGQVVDRSSATFPPDVKLDIEAGPRFVSRGGEKLQAALDEFTVSVAGLTCADVGASTGGFTDCLLQRGAARVYALDVGKGLLHWKLRTDPRVVVMEGTNARYVESLPEPVELVTIDASFISLKTLLPVVRGWFFPLASFSAEGKMKDERGTLITLIKPQFEAGRKESAKGEGVIRDPQVHRRVLTEVLTFAKETGFSVRGLIRSPLLGPKGNVEFLAWLGTPSGPAAASLEEVVGALFRDLGPPVEQV
jgi:23S rRNA (cytidine1920-2'-O)/16S rRNA (cytidine1409-2'-O)-methyltransferase